MERKINMGVLGCADIAKRLVIPNMLHSGKFNVVAIASRTRRKANEFAELFNCKAIVGYEELIKQTDIHAVYIPLPTGLHYEWIMRALQAGKHVLAEKSIAMDISETNHIVNTAKKNKLCVFENFMFVFHSQFDFVKQKIDNGEIGKVKLLRSSFGFPPFNEKSNIRYNKKLGGGALLDAGAYTIMASHFLLGRKQKIIASSLRNENREVDFQGSAMLINEDGVVSQLAFGFDNYYQNNIELWGNRGKLIVERAFTVGPGFAPKIVIEQQNVKHEYNLPVDNHFQKLLIKFHSCIINCDIDFLFDQILCQSKLLTEVRDKNATV